MKITGRVLAQRSACSPLWRSGLTTGPAGAADQALIDAAKKEGSVTWYPTQIINQFVLPAAQGLSRRGQYGVTVNYVRADASEVALRVANEAHAGKVQADVIDGTLTTPALEKEGLVAKYVPDAASHLPKQYADPNGYWVATNLYVLTPAFNTNLVPKGSEPKTYADLLDPKWKGKIAWSFERGIEFRRSWFCRRNVLADMGEDKGMVICRSLANAADCRHTRHPRGRCSIEVISGEYSVALQTFNQPFGSISARTRERPSQWIPMKPGDGRPVDLIGDDRMLRIRMPASCLVEFSGLSGWPE